MSEEWDTTAHMRDVRANPANYVTMASVIEEVNALQAIRKAPTLDALRNLWRVISPEMRDSLEAAKDKRKEELSV